MSVKRSLLVLVNRRLDIPIDPMFGDIDATLDMLRICYNNRSDLYDENIPVYYANPDDYDLYDCGTYDDVDGFHSSCPFVLHAAPKFLGHLSDLLEVK